MVTRSARAHRGFFLLPALGLGLAACLLAGPAARAEDNAARDDRAGPSCNLFRSVHLPIVSDAGLEQRLVALGYPDPAGMEPRDWIQAYYARMIAKEPSFATPREQAEHVLRLAQASLSDLVAFEQVAYATQVERVEEAEERLRQPVPEGLAPAEAAYFEASRAYATDYLKDRITAGNAHHVKGMLENLDRHRASVRALFERLLGRALTEAEAAAVHQYMRALVAVHDLGKSFPVEQVMAMSARLAYPPTMPALIQQRIPTHSLSDVARIEVIRESLGLGREITDSLIRNLTGHDDGSGLPDVWWNAVGHPPAIVGPYPLPTTLPGMILAFLDRAGSGTLGESGGAVKILKEQLAGGRPWGRKLALGALPLNAGGSLRQMVAIADRVEKELGIGFKDLPIFAELTQGAQATLDAWDRIEWDPSSAPETDPDDPRRGRMGERVFATAEEFLELLIGR